MAFRRMIKWIRKKIGKAKPHRKNRRSRPQNKNDIDDDSAENHNLSLWNAKKADYLSLWNAEEPEEFLDLKEIRLENTQKQRTNLHSDNDNIRPNNILSNCKGRESAMNDANAVVCCSTTNSESSDKHHQMYLASATIKTDNLNVEGTTPTWPKFIVKGQIRLGKRNLPLNTNHRAKKRAANI